MTLVSRAVGALVAVAALSVPSDALSAQTPVELDGIIVTATATPAELSRLGNHVTLLDGDALIERGINRVSDALREVPGIAVARSGSFGGVTSVFFRGGESDYVQVMIDGVQVNQPGGSFDFSGLTTENVERIEIVRGPSSALHGSDAVAGVIHIITKSGAGLDGARGSASVQAGSFGRVDTSIETSGAAGRGSYALSLARYRTDGILDFNNDAENTVLSGKASVSIDDRTLATVSARLGERTYAFPTDFSGNVVDRNQFTFSDEASVSLTLQREFGERSTFRAVVSTYAVDGGTDDAPDSPADTLGSYGFQSLDAFRRTSVDLRGAFGLGAASTLTVGTEFEDQDVRSFSESLSAFGTSNGRSANARSNRALYAQLAGELDRVDVNVGGRIEDNERYGRVETWQVGASIPLGETTRLRGVAGSAFKEPTFFETYATGFAMGNPDLDPERSTSIEIGVEQTLLDGDLRLQATWFDQSFTDLIQYTFTPEVPGGPNFYNVAEADAGGVEFSADLKRGPLHLFGDWTFLSTEVIDSGFDSGEGASFVEGGSLLRRPDDTGRLGLSVNVAEGVRLDGVARYVGERQDRDFTAFPAAPVVLDAYTLVDVGAAARVLEAADGRPGVELTIRVENLTDADYAEVFGFRTPGRGIYLGGRLEWGGR